MACTEIGAFELSIVPIWEDFWEDASQAGFRGACFFSQRIDGVPILDDLRLFLPISGNAWHSKASSALMQ